MVVPIMYIKQDYSWYYNIYNIVKCLPFTVSYRVNINYTI